MRPLPKPILIVLAGGVALASIVITMRAPRTSTPEVPASAPDGHGRPMPAFARPEEAARYRDAVAAGNRRAIEAIDEALARAKEAGANPTYVNALERARAGRE